MGNQDNPQTEWRMQTMARYSQALAVGDLATIAAVLRLAENDPILEAMLLQVDSLSEAQDGVTVPADQLLLARAFLHSLRAGPLDESGHWILNSTTSPQKARPKGHRATQERKVRPMQQEPYRLPPSTGASRRTGERGPRFLWAAGFMRSAVAVLIVGALIAGFLLVLSQHSDVSRQTTRGEPGTPAGIYFSRPDGVYRLDIQTRKVIWHTRVPGLSSMFPAGPEVIGDTVFLTTYMLPIPTVPTPGAGAKGTAVVYALDARTGAIRWTHDFPGPTGGAYEDEGLVYFAGTLLNRGNALYNALYVINPANGKITATYISSQGSWGGLPIGGYVYYLSRSTSSIDAVELPSQKLAWQQPIGYNWASISLESIIVQNGVVYLEIGQIYSKHEAGIIEAFDAHTGSKLWQTPLLPFYQRTDFATGDMLYAGGKNVLAFNVHTHALVWTAPYDTYDIQSDSGRLFVRCCSDSPQIAVLNATTGKLIWHLQSNTLGLQVACIYNGVVYVQGFDINGQSGTIIALNAATGKQLWTMPTGVPADQWGGLVVA